MEFLHQWLSGPTGLTQTHNTFARRHVLAEIAGTFTAGASMQQLADATDRYLSGAGVVVLGEAAPGDARFTTQSLLSRERVIVDGAERRRGAQVGIVAADSIVGKVTDAHPALSADQAAAISTISSGGHGVDLVSALAGTGKTTMLAAVAECYRVAGYRVIGTAPTARAARELRDTARVPAGTMHALIGEVDRAGGFPQRTVLVIDEAGMAPTRITAALFAHAEKADTKIIGVGDPGQLASVQAGGWLGALAQRHAGPELRRVIRQHDPDERAALEALHDGHPTTTSKPSRTPSPSIPPSPTRSTRSTRS